MSYTVVRGLVPTERAFLQQLHSNLMSKQIKLPTNMFFDLNPVIRPEVMIMNFYNLQQFI